MFGAAHRHNVNIVALRSRRSLNIADNLVDSMSRHGRVKPFNTHYLSQVCGYRDGRLTQVALSKCFLPYVFGMRNNGAASSPDPKNLMESFNCSYNRQ